MRALATRTEGARWLTGPDAATEPACFSLTCPHCSTVQTQRGFSRASLLRSLDAGLEIEAYCVNCGRFWALDLRVRHALACEFAS
jgi:hypothetical protein